MSKTFKPVPIRPLTGELDLQSGPDELADGACRWRQNFDVGRDGRLARSEGWTRLLPTASNASYNNADLHDQMIPAQVYYGDTDPKADGADETHSWPASTCSALQQIRADARQHVTMIFQCQSDNSTRRLIVATKSRIYELNENSGNWRLIGDGFGAPGNDFASRWQATQNGDTIVLTNDYDPVQFYTLDAPTKGCDMRAVQPITDLLDVLNIERAGAVFTSNGVTFVGNIVQGGLRYPGRNLWSDVNNPTVFDAAAQTNSGSNQTGYADMPHGGKILKYATISNTQGSTAGFIVYCDKVIYYATGGLTQNPLSDNPADVVLGFNYERVYADPDGKDCMEYPESLINDGSDHYYFRHDGFFRFNLWRGAPEYVEWLNKGGAHVISTLDRNYCNGHCAGYWKDNTRMYWSWIKVGEDAPSETFTANPENKYCSYIDHGFTSFGIFQSDPRYTWRDYLRYLCVCSDADDASTLGYVKEGLPIDNDCPSPPAVLFTTETMLYDGMELENWDAAGPSADSLCALLAETASIDDFCRECNKEVMFIGASAADMCLKEFGSAYSREVCTNAGQEVGILDGFRYRSFPGVYQSLGYLSRINYGPMDFGNAEVEKLLNELTAIAYVDPSLPFLWLGIRMGANDDPVDSQVADGQCDVRWQVFGRRKLQCPMTYNGQGYNDRKLAPSVKADDLILPMLVKGRYVYLELTIGEPSNAAAPNSMLVPGIGGSCYLASVTMQAKTV